MATYRGQGASSYDVGQAPPYVSWTFVKGDTASFKVYVTDDLKHHRLPIERKAEA